MKKNYNFNLIYMVDKCINIWIRKKKYKYKSEILCKYNLTKVGVDVNSQL